MTHPNWEAACKNEAHHVHLLQDMVIRLRKALEKIRCTETKAEADIIATEALDIQGCRGSGGNPAIPENRDTGKP